MKALAELRHAQAPMDAETMHSLVQFVEELAARGVAGKDGVDSVLRAFSEVVEMLIRRREWDNASKFIEAMIKAHLPISPSFFNQLLLHKVICNNLVCAWEVWSNMQANSIKVTQGVLQSIAKKGLLWDTLAEAIRRGKPPDTEDFRYLFKNLELGDVDAGKRLLRLMKVAGVPPNTFCYNSVLFMMTKHARREVQASVELFSEMEANGVAPNVATYNALMTIKSKTGDMNGCYELFDEMQRNKLVPDVYSYNILMDIKGKQRDEGGLTNILNTLLASNTAPTRASLNILLRVIADRGDMNSCRQVLTQIKRQFGSANVFGYNCLLECVAKQGNEEECKAILKEMQRSGIDPDPTTLNTILKHFPGPCELHPMVKKVKRDTRTYNILLNTAICQRDANSAIALLKQMKHEGLPPDSSTYSTILKGIVSFKDASEQAPGSHSTIDASLATRCLAEFDQAIKDLTQAGILPDVVSYQILVAEAAENGYLHTISILLASF